MVDKRRSASARARATRLASAKHRRETAERPGKIARAFELRVQGFTEREIAEQIGCSLSQAHVYLVDALAKGMAEIQERGREYVHLELERLEQPIRFLQRGIQRGDADAIREHRSLSESRRKLLGLDAQRDQGDGSTAVNVTFSFAGKAEAKADVHVAGAVGAAGADGVRPAPGPVDRNGNEDR